MNKYFLTIFALLSFQSAFNQANHLIELKSCVPHIKYSLAYATKENFTGKRIYPKNTYLTYLTRDAAEALTKVALALEKFDLGILVWDAYRPHQATVKFWNLIHDERYVANPVKGSGHNRGIAIDMTLYKLSSGDLINMPTEFDHFSDTAHHGYMALNEEKIKNREFLKTIMEQNGFQSFQTEWWHYSWPNDKGYEILNIPFRTLKNQ